ncbi:MAG: WcaI family glycosyltransferase [Terracidiphilus sp.]|nr:WcaI family glycosyltransferase [Terracidiphilus sp.]
MRILILSINYWPEVTGIGAFTTYRAEYLAAAGHDVEVCTTFPYYPEWKVMEGYCGKLRAIEERNGVRIHRSWAYIPNPVTSLKRIMHEGSFVASCLANSLFMRRPDVLLVVSPPLGLALNAIILSRIWRIPYVFDVEDLQPDSAADLSMLPSWALKLLYKTESAAYRYARLISTLTDGMRDKIITKGIQEEKVVLFEPRVDDALLKIEASEGIAFRARYGLGDKVLVTHSGNMGVKQGLDVIIEAAVLTKSDESILFLLVGNGTVCERIQRLAVELGLRNVRFLPLLEAADFRGLLAASDLCLVTQQKTVSDIAFPSKIVTYLAAGRAVIASVNSGGEVARAIRDSGAGKVVVPEDAQALRAAILELRGAQLKEYGAKAAAYASQRWSSARVLAHLERSLISVAASGTTPVAEIEGIR